MFVRREPLHPAEVINPVTLNVLHTQDRARSIGDSSRYAVEIVFVIELSGSCERRGNGRGLDVTKRRGRVESDFTLPKFQCTGNHILRFVEPEGGRGIDTRSEG